MAILSNIIYVVSLWLHQCLLWWDKTTQSKDTVDYCPKHSSVFYAFVYPWFWIKFRVGFVFLVKLDTLVLPLFLADRKCTVHCICPLPAISIYVAVGQRELNLSIHFRLVASMDSWRHILKQNYSVAIMYYSYYVFNIYKLMRIYHCLFGCLKSRK